MYNGYNGGYVLIDCKGLDLLGGETPQTINGLHAATVAAMQTGKPMLAYNLKWGETLNITPVAVFAIDFGDYIIITASTLQVVVTTQDVVTVVNMAPAA